jgi:TPR repeat protein
MAWYKKAAGQRYARAQFYLGRMFEQGLGVEKDIAQASNWYFQAVALGHVRAGEQLAKVKYEHAKTHEKIIPQKQETAEQVQNAEKGVPALVKGKGEADQAQDNEVTLTTDTQKKEEAPQKTLKTKDKYLTAAKRGDSNSQYYLGLLYLNGEEGYKMDAEEAAYWFRRAAENGNTSAQNNLGLLYLNGEGVEKSQPKGLSLLQKAAYSGNVDAQNNLGKYYLEKDYFLASYWFLQAAKQGLADAQYKLAVMYLDGLGIKQNKERAEYWMQKAANQGYLIAVKTLATITEKQPKITSNN